ncbi:hypothetical protein MKW98_001004 [Papaver atlanticum]|uniref:Endoplasmic reticulum transmembrane protein n=1 Tax=Papaver atlanticum TaxID=357466 RepID=A0AAD4SEF6_9MAGN|nr:hypothetical protein MKW98_001004 [Papaver atlanticum]
MVWIEKWIHHLKAGMLKIETRYSPLSLNQILLCRCSDHVGRSMRNVLFFLTAFSLFLWFVIYRLHHYLTKMCPKTKLQLKIKEKEEKALKERRLLNEEDRRALAAESDVAALQKQSNDLLLLEYDRLLEDNQNLQCQNLGCR